MTVLINELKRSKISLIIWSAAISFMLAVTVFVFPLISKMMEGVDFSNLGAFGSSLGAVGAVFSNVTDYFCVEATSVLGLGGAMFAAIAGASALSKEVRDHTAEYLFTHPVSRMRIAGEKLASVVSQVLVLNLAAAAVSALAMLVIREKPEFGNLALFLLSLLFLQLEAACITYAVSAFAPRGSVGIGIGIVFGFYFLNLISELTDKLSFLKYLTPYSYTNYYYIKAHGALDFKYIAVGLAIAVLCVAGGLLKFRKKDL